MENFSTEQKKKEAVGKENINVLTLGSIIQGVLAINLRPIIEEFLRRELDEFLEKHNAEAGKKD